MKEAKILAVSKIKPITGLKNVESASTALHSVQTLNILHKRRLSISKHYGGKFCSKHNSLIVLWKYGCGQHLLGQVILKWQRQQAKWIRGNLHFKAMLTHTGNLITWPMFQMIIYKTMSTLKTRLAWFKRHCLTFLLPISKWDNYLEVCRVLRVEKEKRAIIQKLEWSICGNIYLFEN